MPADCFKVPQQLIEELGRVQIPNLAFSQLSTLNVDENIEVGYLAPYNLHGKHVLAVYRTPTGYQVYRFNLETLFNMEL